MRGQIRGIATWLKSWIARIPRWESRLAFAEWVWRGISVAVVLAVGWWTAARAWAEGVVAPYGTLGYVGVVLCVALALTLLLMGIAWAVAKLRGDSVHVQRPEEPADSFFLADDQFEGITGRVFMNEEVSLDGRWYDHCRFSGCTFRFNGKLQYRISNSEIFPPVGFATDNSGISAMIKLLHDFGVVTLPMVDGRGHIAASGLMHTVTSREGKIVQALPGGKIDHTQDTFKGLAINIGDFYTGTREPLRGKEFVDCEVIGPFVVAFMGRVSIDEESYMGHNDFVQIKSGAKIANVIAFTDITIRRSTFRGMTILVPEDLKHTIPDDANWITRITKEDQSAGSQSPPNT